MMELELLSGLRSDVPQMGGVKGGSWTQNSQQTRGSLEATTDEVTTVSARMPNTTTIICRGHKEARTTSGEL
jgi:hypothetical protein